MALVEDGALLGPRQLDMGNSGSDAVEAAAAHGRRALRLETDLTSADQVTSMVEAVVSEFDGVDILVNNARVEFGKPFVDVTEAEWDAVMDFNVKSTFLCCQAVGRHMLAQGKGSIVNVGSGLAVRGLANSAVACASQGAIHQLHLSPRPGVGAARHPC